MHNLNLYLQSVKFFLLLLFCAVRVHLDVIIRAAEVSGSELRHIFY